MQMVNELLRAGVNGVTLSDDMAKAERLGEYILSTFT